MGIAFFGGRFDPFHSGHLDIIRQTLQLPTVTRLHVIPAAHPPHKPVTAPFLLRVALINHELKKAGLDHVHVDLQEYNRLGPSYTIDTVKMLEATYPKTQLLMVIGADTLPQLATWRDSKILLSRVQLIIAKRPHFDINVPNLPRQPIVINTHDHSTATQLRLIHPIYQRFTIGITGRVGSGKSTAAKFINETLGIRIIDLDQLGHAILRMDSIKTKLKYVFSDNIFDPDGEINRATLGQIVFSTSTQLANLNNIVHPAIRQLAIEAIHSDTTPCLLVGALLVELNLISVCHHVLVIDAESESIARHIGEKFEKIKKHQRNRDTYKLDGTVIKNTYNNAFLDSLLGIVTTLLFN